MTALLEYIDLHSKIEQPIKTPGAAITGFGQLSNSATLAIICSGKNS